MRSDPQTSIKERLWSHSVSHYVLWPWHLTARSHRTLQWKSWSGSSQIQVIVSTLRTLWFWWTTSTCCTRCWTTLVPPPIDPWFSFSESFSHPMPLPHTEVGLTTLYMVLAHTKLIQDATYIFWCSYVFSRWSLLSIPEHWNQRFHNLHWKCVRDNTLSTFID